MYHFDRAILSFFSGSYKSYIVPSITVVYLTWPSLVSLASSNYVYQFQVAGNVILIHRNFSYIMFKFVVVHLRQSWDGNKNVIVDSISSIRSVCLILILTEIYTYTLLQVKLSNLISLAFEYMIQRIHYNVFLLLQHF